MKKQKKLVYLRNLLIFRNRMLLANGLYLSGGVFIGLATVLSSNYYFSLFSALICFLAYISLVSFASVITDYLYREASLSSPLLPFKKGLVTSAIVTLAILPIALVLNYLGTRQIGPAIYFFYSTCGAITVFLTTIIHSIVMERSMMDMIAEQETEKKKVFLDFSMELVKTSMWAIVFLVIGTVFSQFLGGARIETGEMILFSYGFVGLFVLGIVPIIKTFVDFLELFIR